MTSCDRQPLGAWTDFFFGLRYLFKGDGDDYGRSADIQDLVAWDKVNRYSVMDKGKLREVGLLEFQPSSPNSSQAETYEELYQTFSLLYGTMQARLEVLTAISRSQQ
ncbi:hypothetical protein E1B28_011780 [Marasmius oreades]|uniref:Uncharacterized protein n=1 Tax=Marasmius oreades TaxID=181124 RepID=A0A9P7RVF2_9AGAR|nr:uncharacterized protein E1B28_011780 [Marasmius oreades]KAG7090173.1 hypothetical protein E1B28_011780 [Marasmius oreades]